MMNDQDEEHNFVTHQGAESKTIWSCGGTKGVQYMDILQI